MKLIFSIIILTYSLFPQTIFENYFLDKTLRIDYFHTGNFETEFYSFDELIEEPYWGGSKINLLDRFNYGKYKVNVYDSASSLLIYSKTYSSLFSEWQTTDEAKNTFRSLSETVTIPYPKNPIKVEFFSRNKINDWIKKFEYFINPKNYFIKKENRQEYKSFQVWNQGSSSEKLDIVFIPEGYTESELDQFKKDCKQFADYLLGFTPFKEKKFKINIWGIEAPSEQSGSDNPHDGIWKKTLLNTQFYTFDTERYIMTFDNKTVRDVAANVPYDQIYIIVNTDKYGGGSIYNYYSVCVSGNRFKNLVFLHEFGHGLASLADEYVTDDVSYENFYDLSVEPADPNITTLIDFNSKWKDMVEPGTLIPTPHNQEYANKVGAYEGAGYVQKGIYRPSMDCFMRSLQAQEFCPVCQRAIRNMVDFYAE